MGTLLKPFVQSALAVFILTFAVLTLSSKVDTAYACHDGVNHNTGAPCNNASPTPSPSASPTASPSPSPSPSPTPNNNENKITWCHTEPNGNQQTLELPLQALQNAGHVNASGNPLHAGDHAGACIEPNPSPLAFSCNSINVSPAFGPNGKFEFGQTYDFSANITGSATSYTWSVNPSSPVLSSTNGTTTSWTAPLTANPSITWVLTLNVSDESQNQSSCQIEFRDPADDVCANIDGFQTSVPNGLHLDASGRNCVSFELGGPPPTNGGGGQVLGASTGKVLGASTTAKAGTSEDMIGLVLVLSGTILVGTSFNAYRKVYAQ